MSQFPTVPCVREQTEVEGSVRLQQWVQMLMIEINLFALQHCLTNGLEVSVKETGTVVTHWLLKRLKE